MAIREWSPRKLALVWAVGLALEALPVAAQLAQNRALDLRAQREQAAMRSRQAAHPVPPATRDSLLRVLREQYGVTVVMRGDSATGIELSSEAKRRAAAMGTRMGEALRGATILMALVLAVLFLPIPIALVWVTAVWVRARRPATRLPLRAPVV